MQRVSNTKDHCMRRCFQIPDCFKTCVCPTVVQRRWPPTCDTCGAWTSSKSPTTSTCAPCSPSCLSGKATPSTTPTTGSAGRSWVSFKHAAVWSQMTSVDPEFPSLQPTPVGSVHIDSGASAITRESHAHRDRASQHPPIRNQVPTLWVSWQ